MSFFGRNGFFGAMTPYTGPYHHSVYAKYSRGGGTENAVGTLGRSFAYKRPRFSDGGGADDTTDSDIQTIQAGLQQQPRQPALEERLLDFMANRDQRYAGSPLNISAETQQLAQQSDDYEKDTAKYADDLRKDAEDVQKKGNPGLPPLPGQRAQGGSVVSNYRKPPRNNANNDQHQGYQAARGGSSYTWGKVGPNFTNEGAEIHPMGHNEMTPRRRAHGGGCSCWRCGGRFARGGEARITPPSQARPFAVSQSTKVGNGLKIHAPHSGGGLVLNIHLSDVGPHAISFGHSGEYSGGVDASRMVERMAMHRLANQTRSTPFPVPQAPPGPAAIPMNAAGFQALMSNLPYSE